MEKGKPEEHVERKQLVEMQREAAVTSVSDKSVDMEASSMPPLSVSLGPDRSRPAKRPAEECVRKSIIKTEENRV